MSFAFVFEHVLISNILLSVFGFLSVLGLQVVDYLSIRFISYRCVTLS